MCGKETQYDHSVDISLRYNYIEGAGQLCDECAYPNEETPFKIPIKEPIKKKPKNYVYLLMAISFLIFFVFSICNIKIYGYILPIFNIIISSLYFVEFFKLKKYESN